MIRPDDAQVTSAAEVEDWYWTRAELNEIARRLGVSRSGSKAEVTARLVAVLTGQPLPPHSRKAVGPQLTPPFRLDMVVPAGQRMTRALRDYLTAQIGPGFRFDAVMREFFAAPAGRSLGDAVQVWHSTRGQEREIPEQFEYNRFTRAFRAKNPDATSRQVREAWAQYKSMPVSSRVRV